MQPQLHRRVRPLSLALLSVGGAWLVGACQQKAPEAQLPETILPETVLLPQSTSLVLALSTKPEAALSNHPDLLAQWKTWSGEALQDKMGYGFSPEDLQSWAKEQVVVAVVEPNLVPNAPEPVPGILVGASTRNRKGAAQFLAQLRQEAEAEGATFERRQEQGVTLHVQTNGDPGEQWVTAELGNHFVAVANDLGVMQQAIAAYRGKAEPLSRSELFQAAANELYTQNSLGFAYVNLEAWQDKSPLGNWVKEADPAAVESLRQVRSVAMALRSHEKGLQMRMLTQMNPQAQLQGGWQPAQGELIQRLPGNALLVITTQQIAQRWQALLPKLEEDPLMKESLKELRTEFRTKTQLDWDETVAWMDGELALLVAPDAEAHPLLQGMGAALVIESSQKEKANATLARLDELVKGFGAKVTQANGQVTWADPIFNQPLLRRTWEGRYLIMTTSAGALQAIRQRQGNLLPETEPLKTLYTQLPKPNYGYFLLNWKGIRTVLESTLPGGMATLGPEAQEVLNRIEGLGVTSYPAGEHRWGLELLLAVSDKP